MKKRERLKIKITGDKKKQTVTVIDLKNEGKTNLTMDKPNKYIHFSKTNSFNKKFNDEHPTAIIIFETAKTGELNHSTIFDNAGREPISRIVEGTLSFIDFISQNPVFKSADNQSKLIILKTLREIIEADYKNASSIIEKIDLLSWAIGIFGASKSQSTFYEFKPETISKVFESKLDFRQYIRKFANSVHCTSDFVGKVNAYIDVNHSKHGRSNEITENLNIIRIAVEAHEFTELSKVNKDNLAMFGFISGSGTRRDGSPIPRPPSAAKIDVTPPPIDLYFQEGLPLCRT